MRTGLLLGAAIVAEVVGTLSLRAAVDHSWWAPVVLVSYAAAFALIGLVLQEGMPIGAVYGIWSATGVALVALLGMILFAETLSAAAVVGIGAIVAGVVLIETGSRKADAPAGAERARDEGPGSRCHVA